MKNNTKNSTKNWGIAFIIAFIVVWVLVVAIKVNNSTQRSMQRSVTAEHEDKLVEAAQNVEIGDGVTLLQGIQAYCGVPGFWNGDADDDTVRVSATGEINHVGFLLAVDLETVYVELIECESEPIVYSSAEELLADMIQAAKG